MRRCEDEKMFYRPPLLEEPCAQTLSGKMKNISVDLCKTWQISCKTVTVYGVYMRLRFMIARFYVKTK